MEVTRKEIKFLITLPEYARVKRLLAEQIQPDLHNAGGGYNVISVYFDSIHDDDLLDVYAGIEVRKKIRLRVYSPLDETAKFEYKYKRGADQTKTSLTVTRAEGRELLGGDYSLLLRRREPIAGKMYWQMQTGVYRPKALIAYRREAYIHPVCRVRITYDSDVRVSLANFDLFDPFVNTVPVMEPGLGVLEVKYDGFLPTFVSKALAGLDEIAEANSKYVRGRIYTLEYV